MQAFTLIRYTIALLLGLSLGINLYGQSTSFLIKGPENGLALEGATVQILHGNEYREGGFTDSLGRYATTSAPNLPFRVVVSYLGLPSIDTMLTEAPARTVVLAFPRAGVWMEAVAVSAKRSFVQRRGDKVILHIGGSDLFGENSLKILESAPGVQVVNEEVRLLGQATAIFLNGKPSKYQPSQLANLLKNRQAHNIDRIELIANPGAEFTADLSGRVINIITKNREGNGYDLSVYGRTTQRSRHTSGSGGVDVYARYNRFGLYLATDNFLSQKLERTTSERLLAARPEGGQVISESSVNSNSAWGPSYSLGLDYDLSDRLTTGIKYLGYVNRGRSNINSTSLLPKAGRVDSTVAFATVPRSEVSLRSLNFNLSALIDTLNSSLNLDLDLDEVANDMNERQALTFSTEREEAGNVLDRIQRARTRETLFGAKLDLIKHLPSPATLKAGVKFSHSDISQHLFQQFDRSDQPDFQFSDELVYRERILSGYLNVERSLGKFSAVLGLRGEHTDYAGAAASTAEPIGLRYFNLFPSVTLTRNFAHHHLRLSFARRVRRPRFNQLIPFRRYRSALQYYTGNPNLIAFFPYRYEVYYTYKNKLFLNVYTSHANNRILEYERVDEENENVTVGVKENNGRVAATGVGAGYNGRLNAWLTLNANAYFRAGSQSIASLALARTFKYTAYSLYASPSFTLGEKTRGNLNFYYNSDTYYSISQTLSYWYFGLYLSRKILAGKGAVSLRVTDLFLTGITRRVADYGDINIRLRNNWDSRRFQLSFSYSFSQENVAGRRNRSRTANNDVRNRASSR